MVFPRMGGVGAAAPSLSLGRVPCRLGNVFSSETWDRLFATEKILVSTFFFSHAIVVNG